MTPNYRSNIIGSSPFEFRRCYFGAKEMPTVKKSLIVPYSAGQMYDLINAIEVYPEFLPWCKATQVHERSATQVKATIHLAKGPINQSITTVNTMLPEQSIKMQYLDGPFKHCNGAWTFTTTKNPQQTEVSFAMDYQFKSLFISLAVEPVFNPIANSLIDAFLKRAEEVYGN